MLAFLYERKANRKKRLAVNQRHAVVAHGDDIRLARFADVADQFLACFNVIDVLHGNCDEIQSLLEAVGRRDSHHAIINSGKSHCILVINLQARQFWHDTDVRVHRKAERGLRVQRRRVAAADCVWQRFRIGYFKKSKRLGTNDYSFQRRRRLAVALQSDAQPHVFRISGKFRHDGIVDVPTAFASICPCEGRPRYLRAIDVIARRDLKGNTGALREVSFDGDVAILRLDWKRA